MKQHEAAEFAALITRWGQGEVLQFNLDLKDEAQWVDCTEVNFQSPVRHYRIKPKPTIRPWKQSEVPVYAWIKLKEAPEERHYLIWVTTPDGVKVSDIGFQTYEMLASNFLTIDNKPCGTITT